MADGDSLGVETVPLHEAVKRWAEQYGDEHLQEYYPRIARRNPRLAEIFRQAVMEPENVNPVQTARKDDRLWCSILLRAKSWELAQELWYGSIEGLEVYRLNGRYLSARLAIDQLPTVWDVLEDLVERIEVARLIQPALTESIKNIQADEDTLANSEILSEEGQVVDGRGVIVGVVDMGGDFYHPHFRDDAGNSRLLYLWDQRKREPNSPGTPPTDLGYYYGREFSQQQLNDALNTGSRATAYSALDYTPQDEAHGTHVMDIVAGRGTPNEPGRAPGVAPAADLIFVHLGLPSPLDRERESLGASTRLRDAIDYIFQRAEENGKPAVINLSLATNGGPHDGSTLLEEEMDTFLQKPGRAIVIAAGNSFNAKIHAASTVAADDLLEWQIDPQAPADHWQRQEMEIWYDSRDRLQLSVETPLGSVWGQCDYDSELVVWERDTGIPLLLVFNRTADELGGEGNGQNQINIFLDDRYPIPSGLWRFRLQQDSDGSGEYHAWIEHNEKYPSRFATADSRTETTLNSIGNGRLPLLVAAYEHDEKDYPIMAFSGAGPSRNPLAPERPDLSAPGDWISAARATHDGNTYKRGTSMAAPHVTGVIALMLQLTPDLEMQEIRDFILKTVDRNPPQMVAQGHDLRYGYGQVNALRAVKALQTSGRI